MTSLREMMMMMRDDKIHVMGKNFLLDISNKTWKEGRIPAGWNTGVILETQSKVDKKNCRSELSILIDIYEK